MKHTYWLVISFLLVSQSEQTIHAVTPLEYATLGVKIASLASFVWGIYAVKNMIEDLMYITYVSDHTQQEDLDLDRDLKRRKIYLTYLKTIEERIKAAYLLKYTPDPLLELANFHEDERALAASLQALSLDDTVDELAWYDFSENAATEDLTETSTDMDDEYTFETHS